MTETKCILKCTTERKKYGRYTITYMNEEQRELKKNCKERSKEKNDVKM